MNETDAVATLSRPSFSRTSPPPPMTFHLRTLAVGALALGLAACGTDTADAPADAPLSDATEVTEAAAEIPAGTYELDAAHTELGFRVRHLGIANVDGVFDDFTGTVTVPESGLSGMSATLTAQVGSIDTDNEDRDGHLESPDFFDAATHPELTFTTTSVEPLGGARFRMNGDLTMRGQTHPVTLEGEYLGTAMMGETTKIGFEAEGTIDRQQWGLAWSETNPAGEAIVADEVKLMIGVEANRMADEPEAADA